MICKHARWKLSARRHFQDGCLLMANWSAGACSRFYGAHNIAQTVDCEVRLQSQKRRRAAALQNGGVPHKDWGKCHF